MHSEKNNRRSRSILAKTLGIPAVVGACGVTDEIENGASLYINGTQAPTTAGIPSVLARITAWEVTPPFSVTKPLRYFLSSLTVSAGVRSCATTINGSVSGAKRSWPTAIPYINGTEGYVVCEPDEALIKQYGLEKEAMDLLADHYAKMLF